MSENTIDNADLVPHVYQTNGKWMHCSAIEFSDTTHYDQYTGVWSCQSIYTNFGGSKPLNRVDCE